MKMDGNSIVAKVNNETVTLDEFMLFANKGRAEVIRFFRNNYNCDYGKDFWSTACPDQTPIDLLKKNTLDTLIHIKIQQELASKYEIAGNFNYIGFQLALEQENNRRKIAKENNQVIFGPEQYSTETYYNYIFSNMVIRLKEKLLLLKFNLLEEDLKAKYEELKTNMFSIGYCSKINVLTITPLILYPTEKRKKQQLKAIELLQSKMRNGQLPDDLDRYRKISKQLNLCSKEYVFNDSIYSGEEDDIFLSLIKKESEKLSPGLISEIIETQNNYYLLQLKEREFLGYRDFEPVRNVVENRLLEENYLKLIADLYHSAEIEINKTVFNQISFN
ncbi:MAG: hypothetical protein K9H49_12555 [Bacteroidales bacterium]|nr:hypothetical protein [Bacteroidales bacterium]MCF8392046.1 hypothetical protein [Bacteroidales bacterium]